jgi:SWI/SNF-related matrix-associated actin-dependent regulator 1 of chromatin subfamily A
VFAATRFLAEDGVGDSVDAGARAGHADGRADCDERSHGARSDTAVFGLGRRDGCGLRAGQPDREIGRDGQLCRGAKASMGLNATTALSASARAALQASLTASVQSLNASGSMLQTAGPALAAALGAQANLVMLLGVVTGVHATYGIDLRAPGAVAALQSALDASAAASASGMASASAAGSASAVASLMASMGFAANAQGAASASAAATAMSRLTLGVPPITANFGALSMLSAAVSLLASVTSTLGVNLGAPNAILSLRAALSTLPLAALAQLRVSASSAATASVATAAQAQAQAAASAVNALNLSAVAAASLTSAGQLAVLMGLTTQASSLLAAPGTCGRRCPLATPTLRAA